MDVYEEYEAGLEKIRHSPADRGTVELIVRRPRVDGREVVEECRIDTVEGLVGDSWKARGNRGTPDGSAKPATQVTIMNSRVIAIIAGDKERWPPAGDQLFVDLDLSCENLPPGTQLRIGDASVEISADPHTGCSKFQERFGQEALKFVNSEVGRQMNLRGVYARIVRSGVVCVGDIAAKI